MNGAAQHCATCLAPVSAAVSTQHGISLCQECAAQFSLTCAGCGGLVPREEAWRAVQPRGGHRSPPPSAHGAAPWCALPAALWHNSV